MQTYHDIMTLHLRFFRCQFVALQLQAVRENMQIRLVL